MRVIDSHTGGQPTRVIVDGASSLGSGTASDQFERMIKNCDHFRTGSVLEPKCDDARVGTFMCQPSDLACGASAIVFNTTGYLGTCGDGLIGPSITPKHLDLIQSGEHLIETPVGVVASKLVADLVSGQSQMSSQDQFHPSRLNQKPYSWSI